jgi:uncharacterized OsmC-like protein
MTLQINGVDTGRMFSTIEAIQADPAIARFQFRLQNRWVGGGENRSVVRDYCGAKQEMAHPEPFELANDEPPVLLGADRAPNPVEYILHALAGCITTTVVYQAAARGIPVRAMATRFEGDLDLRGFLGLSEEVRRGFSNIRISVDLDVDADEATKRELIALAQARSPVVDIVTNGVPVQLLLNEQPAQRAA